MRRANGQPMNDKRGGASFIRRNEQNEERVFSSLHEIEKQRNRVEMLEDHEFLKSHGMNKQHGLIMSVENIPRIKEEIEKASRGEARYTQATIRKYKKKLIELEAFQADLEQAENNLSEQAKTIIDSEEVTQWAKNPTIYFVKGLRKVALELGTDGKFKESSKYRAKTEEDKRIVSEMLK
jgi:hypothetical protein